MNTVERLKLRRTEPALHGAAHSIPHADDTSLIYERGEGGEITCAFNFKDKPISLDHAGSGEALNSTNAKWTDGKITLPPFGALVARKT